jgi:arylsulfatase A-like enzyme
VLVSVDTLRADHVGVYGGPVPTPALDRLAAEGVFVDGACTPTPTTGPAHASLLSGLHPWRHGVLDNAVPLSSDVHTVAEWAQAAGIPTAAFVSSYILHPRFGLARGFDHYHFDPDQGMAWRGALRSRFWAVGEDTTRAALAWIRGQPGAFFVWIHYFDTHGPYAPAPGFERPRNETVSLEGKTLPPGVAGEEELRALNRAYRGEVAYVDAQIHALVEGLRQADLLEGTAIVVTSDHGEGLGDHGHLEHGHNLFDELVRVPLIVRAPGIPAGRALRGDVQLEDLGPTLLSLLGLAAPPDVRLDGRDLLSWLRGEAPASPRAAVVGRRKPYANEADLFYARQWPEKWIGPLAAPGARFALEADPREARPEPDARVPAALHAALAGADRDAAQAPRLDDEARRALEALGYLEP